MEIRNAEFRRQQNRLRLRRLDACLNQLEELHMRDLLTVPAEIASSLRPLVPDARPGMLVAEAIERVFEQQEACLAPAPDREEATPSEPLDERTARALTDRIKTATRQVCLLLLKAHDGRAWQALGYRTWALYVRREFGLSRPRSYELLDQARVIRAVSAAAGLSGIPDISAYAASQIKARLDEVLQTIRLRTAGLTGRRAAAVVSEVIREARAPAGRRSPRVEVVSQGEADGAREGSIISSMQLNAIVRYLASMPPATEVATELRDDLLSNFTLVQLALQWLGELATACEHLRAAADERLSDESDSSMSLAAG